MPKITYTDKQGNLIGYFDEEKNELVDADGNTITLTELKHKRQIIELDHKEDNSDSSK